MYPYRLYITDPARIKYYKTLKEKRAIILDDRSLITKIGHDLKPIRKDVVIAPDRRFFRSGIMLTPKIEMDMKPWKNGVQITFESIFSGPKKKTRKKQKNSFF